MKFKNKVKNVTSKVISQFWGTLEQVTFDFTFRNGKTVQLTHEVYGKTDGVAVLLYNPTTNKVILSKQFRMPVYVAGIQNGFSIEVVGGAIDTHETPEITAIRETEEEVGLQISEIIKITTSFLSPGILKEQVHLFIAYYSDADKTQKGGGLFEEDEEIQVLELSFEDAFKMIETQEIIDARTILLLQYLKIHKTAQFS